MLIQRTKGKYMHILGSDGTLRMTVPEGTEGAVKREYETSDGKKGTKYEVVYEAIKGFISKMAFYDGDYGKTLNVRIVDVEHDPVTIVFNTTQTFGEDFMKKLPNINLKQEVVIRPYSFVDEEGRTKRGVAITQGNRKITNFFYDIETKKPKNGYPEPEGDTKAYDKEDWKIFYMQARKFLIAYTQDNIIGKVEKHESDKSADEVERVPYPEESINPDEIPW